MVYSSFLNITNFTLSKVRYFIISNSKLLSFCYCSYGQGFSFSLTSCTDLPLFSNLWPCCCLCTDLHTDVVGLATFTTHFAICWALYQRMFCTTESTVLSHSTPILSSIATFVLVPLNRVKFLVFL